MASPSMRRSGTFTKHSSSDEDNNHAHAQQQQRTGTPSSSQDPSSSTSDSSPPGDPQGDGVPPRGPKASNNEPKAKWRSRSSRGYRGISQPDLTSPASYRSSPADASTCALAKKDREERMKMIRERQIQEQERRENALKEAQEREQRRVANLEKEKLEKVKKLREREVQRQKAVYDKRKQMEEVDSAKKEAMLAKYRAQSENRLAEREKNRKIYAFGSSTPRVLAYLQNLTGDQRVYDKKLVSEPLTKEELEALNYNGSPGGNGAFGSPVGGARNNSSSSVSRVRRGNTTGTENSDSIARGRTAVRSPPDRSKVGNMRTQSALAQSNVMTQSYSAGEGASRPHANPRRKTPTLRQQRPVNRQSLESSSVTKSTISSQNRGSQFSTSADRPPPMPNSTRRSGPAPPSANNGQVRKTPAAAARVSARRSVPGEPESSKAQAAAPSSAGPPGARRRIQPATTASAEKRRPVSASVPPRSGRRSMTTAQKSAVAQEQAKKNVEMQNPRPVPRRVTPVTSPTTTKKIQEVGEGDSPTPQEASPPTTSPSPPGTPPDQKRLRSSENEEIVQSSAPTTSGTTTTESSMESSSPSGKSQESMELDQERRGSDESLGEQILIVETLVTPATPTPPSEQDSEEKENIPESQKGEEHSQSLEDSPLIDFGDETPRSASEGVEGPQESLADQLDAAERAEKERERVQTEQNEAAAKAALMEQRRLAREAMEREKERLREIEEEERRQEEERIRLEEEEFRRQEQEELQLAEELRRAEEERLKIAIELEETRKAEERARLEEEEARRRQEEENMRLERERMEKELREKEEKFRREQEEREERRKRLSAIMSRTRQSGNSPSAATSSNSTSTNTSASNSSGEGQSTLLPSNGTTGKILHKLRQDTSSPVRGGRLKLFNSPNRHE